MKARTHRLRIAARVLHNARVWGALRRIEDVLALHCDPQRLAEWQRAVADCVRTGAGLFPRRLRGTTEGR